MHDVAFEYLLSCLGASENSYDKTLLVADEHAAPYIQNIAGLSGLSIISNRFDVVEAARNHHIEATFSDFDFSHFAQGSYSRILYRISKEKPVVHHVINEASHLLAQGGQLRLVGFKNEGTKTYIEKTKKYFGNGESKKQGSVYSGTFTKTALPIADERLDTQNYASLRLIEGVSLPFYSKPGLFGWNKVDQGSAFLAAHLPLFLAGNLPLTSLLDLGCGYGYLMLQSRHLPLIRRVATDNNAAAMRAAQENFSFYGMQVETLADDCGASLQAKFDLILCNPPFHRGFETDGALTVKFLQHIRRLLAPNGVAVLVVNQFIGLENAAAPYFKHIKTVADNGQFRLFSLQQHRV